MEEKLTQQRVEYFIDLEDDEFYVDRMREKHGIAPDSSVFHTSISRLVKDKRIRRKGRGLYKKIRQIKPVQVFGVDRERKSPVTLIFPRDFNTMMEMDFAEHIVIREGDLILISGLSNYGKALRNGTPILTPNGWTAINKLIVGDTVFDSDGRPVKILGVYPQNLRQCFRFIFNDGTFIDSDNEHLWQIQTGYSRLNKETGRGKPNSQWHKWSILSTKEIIKLCGGIGEVPLHQRFIIPNNEPVQFEKQEVELNPYFLGLLLGDGTLTNSTPRISTSDNEIVDYIRELGFRVNYVSQYDYRILGIYNQMKMLGLKGTKSDTKFVPKKYLFNDIETRLAVLQGLMDTDGYIHKNSKSIEYSTCSKQLADDVSFLVRSLGGRCRIYSYDSHYTYKGQSLNGKPKYRVNIKMNNLNPFKLKRKADGYKGFTKTDCRVIRQIDFVKRHHTTCIKIDSPTGLFIAKDFIVTHNTTLCMSFAGENIDMSPVLMGNEYTDANEEPLPRFLNRLDNMDWVQWANGNGSDKFTLLPVREDYAEHIVKDRLNIVDWINIATGEHYMIGTILDGLKRQAGKGIVIAAIQKAEGAEAGRGGQFTKDFADVELLVDKFGSYETLLTIGKVKEYTQPVTGRTYAFSISKGVRIINFREVIKCNECRGSGYKVGQKCENCDGKKMVDA